MKSSKASREFPEGHIPLVDVEGTAYEAGIMLGYTWEDTFKLEAQRWPAGSRPWWMDKRFRKLISRHAPHLPDIYRGMAKGAGVPEDRISTPVAPETSSCTSFAIQPAATLDGHPISGQTKDTGGSRCFRYQVLRLKLKVAPSALTLTYPGWLFGHGFVAGGCSVFRNSLYVKKGDGMLPYFVWGVLALHCKTVEEAAELAKKHGVQEPAHCTVADEHGGIAGLEMGKGGVAVIKPRKGIYTHANAVVSGKPIIRHQKEDEHYLGDSLHRQERLRLRLEADRGRLTAQLAYMALCDHDGYPRSVCRHESLNSLTTAAVVVEPTRGLLHVSRGAPCRNWPQTYCLYRENER
jgi:isopenicillin-N N-acyltransferase-like protein